MRAHLDDNPLSRRHFLQGAAWLAAGACLAVVAPQIVMSASPNTPETPGGKMLTRTIPSSGQAIPVIGMGTSRTFDASPKDAAALQPLEEVLKLFHAGGGRLVDTSPMYGKAEEVTGILAGRLGLTQDLFLATKVWTTGEQEGIRQMERSLSLLKREKLELMQIHNLLDWQTHYKTLRKWKEQGKFRYIGVTHYQESALADLERVLRQEKFDFVQLNYSVEERGADTRMLPAMQDLGVAVLVNRPFVNGALFRQMNTKALPDSVKGWAGSWAQAFLKYAIAHPAVTCVIPATRNPKHMEDNLRAGFGRLPDERERNELVKLIKG